MSDVTKIKESDKYNKTDENRLGFIIQKPQFLSDVCVAKKAPNYLPPIEKISTVTKKPKIVSEEESQDSIPVWLKPGVSLPKLRTRNVEVQEFEESIFYPESVIKPCLGKIPKECPRMISCKSQLSSDSLNFDFQFQEINNKISAMGPTVCEFPFQVTPSQLNFDDISLPEEKLEESNALKRWDYWLKQRKITQDYLKKKVKIDVCDLLFNRIDEHRKMIEKRELLQHYRKYEVPKTFADLLRSDTSSNKKKNSKKSKIPKLENIGTSLIIKKEKNLPCENERPKCQKCYFETLVEEKTKHHIDMDELAVVGHGIPREEPVHVPISTFDVIPKIIITPPDNDDYLVESTSEFCLVIDDVEIKYNLDACREWNGVDGDSPTWNIDFGTNEIGKLYEKVIYVENRGTVAIKYKWTMKPRDQRPLQMLLESYKYEPWFFFDKNTGIFLPGQKYCLKFYLKGKKSGTRTETWFLNTFPPLYSNVEHATFKFFAVVVGDCKTTEIKSIENYLNRRVGESIAKYILNNIIIYSLMQPHYFLDHIEYRSLLKEKDLFEYHNQQHYYNSTTVNKLKILFSEISNVCKTYQTEWDLYFGTLVTLVLTNIKTKKEKENYLREIYTLSNIALKPVRTKKKKNLKYVMVYQVLCKMVNFMEVDYEYFKSCVTNPQINECECEWECQGNGEDEGESYFDEDKLEGEIDLSLTSYEDRLKSDSSKIIDFSRFYAILYIKTYYRLCQAVEEMVGIIETRKFLEPWNKKKFTDY